MLHLETPNLRNYPGQGQGPSPSQGHTDTTNKFFGDMKSQMMAYSMFNNKNSIFDLLKSYVFMFLLDLLFSKMQIIIDYVKKYIYKEPNCLVISGTLAELCAYVTKNVACKNNFMYLRDDKDNTLCVTEAPMELGYKDVKICRKNGDGTSSVYIFSYILTSEELKQWYLKMKRENTQKKTYYFQKNTMQKNKTFRHSVVKSNRTFDNLFGQHIVLAKEKIDFFINNKHFYDKIGNPYTIGILLYGPPGTGKTSFIKAISNYLNRCVVSIDLKHTTKSQLFELFTNDYLMSSPSDMCVPLDERIYIFEDVDCLGDIVLDRKIKEEERKKNVSKIFNLSEIKMNGGGGGPNNNNNNNVRMHSSNDDDIPEEDQLDLNFLLNILDGVVETPGRIVIMTSNYPEKLDKALIRPGRIDFKIKFDYCTNEIISLMFKNFFTDSTKTFEGFGPDEVKILPFTVNQLLCENWNSEEMAFQRINELKLGELQDMF